MKWCFLLYFPPPSSQRDSIWAMMFVWRLRRKIITIAVLCCAQWYTHILAVFTVVFISLASGFIFYHAMHYSAKRSLAYACQLSVRLSVCNVGGSWPCTVGWKSWKRIAQPISPTSSLFIAQRSSTYYQGNMEKFWGDYRWGGKKWRAGAQKRQ